MTESKKDRWANLLVTTTKGTDLPPRQLNFARETISYLYTQVCISPANEYGRRVPKSKQPNLRAEKRLAYATSIKRVLDAKFSPEWHVIVGTKMGYSVKYRRKTLGIFRFVISDGGPKELIIIYKSPGYELMSANMKKFPSIPMPEGTTDIEGDLSPTSIPPRNTASEQQSAEDTPARHSDQLHKKTTSQKINIFRQCLTPDVSQTAVDSTMSEIADIYESMTTDNYHDLAAAIRCKMTACFGTIWHTVVGEEFAVATVEGKDTFLLNFQIENLNVCCFRHKQIAGTFRDALFGTLPLISVLILCLAGLGKTAVCKKFPVGRFSLLDRLCSDEAYHYTIYACLLIFLISNVAKFTTRIKS